jgi:biofilm PGA synthesis N-glycosyltransferase PgaC
MISAFACAFGFVLYTYAVYPGLVMLIAYWSRLDRTAGPVPVALPVAVVIPCYNEARHIRQKIENILASDYPGGLLRVVIVSDGSTDDTVAIASSVPDPRVKVIACPDRRGKVAAVNLAVAATDEPVLVLTDASERFDVGAIRALVARLADSTVGAVSGELHIVNAETGVSQNLGLYWRYEKAIRQAESEVGSVIGVTGSIYAIRRECFPRVPNDTILDDLAIPLEVVRQGYRVQFEASAMAYEAATLDIVSEFERKRRTLAGNYQLFARYADLLNPLESHIAIQFWSHKVFRLLVPYALVVIFVGTWFLAEPVRLVLVAAQTAFYGLAAAAFLLGERVRGSLLTFPYTFCALNWAAVAGLYVYVSGRQTSKWEKVK